MKICLIQNGYQKVDVIKSLYLQLPEVKKGLETIANDLSNPEAEYFWKRIKVAIDWNRKIFDENIFEEELKLLLF